MRPARSYSPGLEGSRLGGHSGERSRAASQTDTPAAAAHPQDDERRLVSREMNGTSEPAGGGLWKQGSVGLPSPEESGFPATHPDMCILRVRRNHLLEASARRPPQRS